MITNDSTCCAICSRTCIKSGRHLGGYALYGCKACDFYFAPASFNATPDYDEAYDTPAYLHNQVEQIRRTEDKRLFARLPTYQVFFENIPIDRRKRKLLDIGCGVGRFGHAAHDAGWDVTGIDISQSAIDIGSSVAPFPMTCTSIDALSRTDSHYDVITAFEVLEHLPKPLDFVKGILLRLTDNGKLFITVPNWDCRWVRRAKNYDAVPPYHVNFFTQNACDSLFEAAGFKKIRSGIICTDPFPKSIHAIPKWAVKRLLRGPRNLGIWTTGEKSDTH